MSGPAWGAPAPVTPASDQPPVKVTVYKAKRQSDAAKAYAADAVTMAALGYEPVSQSWADGRSGCLRWILLGGFGALVIKPAGTLTVTYRLREMPRA